MNAITNLSPQQLREAADIQERIQELQNQLNELLGAPAEAPAGGTAVGRPKRRQLSPQAIANIRAGVKKRMAAQAKAMGRQKPASQADGARKRKISAAGKKRLAEIARARWAKVKAAGRTKL